jgi:hypothetical protein
LQAPFFFGVNALAKPDISVTNPCSPVDILKTSITLRRGAANANSFGRQIMFRFAPIDFHCLQQNAKFCLPECGPSCALSAGRSRDAG